MKSFSMLTRLMTTVFIILIFNSCKKEVNETVTPVQEEEAANYFSQSETESELVFNDVFDNVMGVNTEVGIGGTGIFGRISSSTGTALMKVDSIPPCVTITITRLNLPDLFPVKIVMDFGHGCPGADGHTRYGKIITTYTGRLIIPGKSATTTFDGFRLDSFQVQGTHKVTNTTASGSNHAQYTVDVTDAKLSKPDGNYTSWGCHRVITQIEGNVTITPIDDIFTIEGTAHGRVKHGNDIFAWQSEITEALKKKFICHWISKGIIRMRRETLPATSPWVAILNYGNGDCDYLATLTINGVTHQIQLPH
jgi:hypothetical protein